MSHKYEIHNIGREDFEERKELLEELVKAREISQKWQQCAEALGDEDRKLIWGTDELLIQLWISDLERWETGPKKVKRDLDEFFSAGRQWFRDRLEEGMFVYFEDPDNPSDLEICWGSVEGIEDGEDGPIFHVHFETPERMKDFKLKAEQIVNIELLEEA